MKIEPCPKCGGTNIWPEMGFAVKYGMMCGACEFVGPRASEGDPDEAIAAWNALSRATPTTGGHDER
jgi:hypothetical protein